MARISTYAIDNNIDGQDKVLGSNSEGLITKNYTFDGIVAWFNATGAVAINEQSNYFFQSVATSTGRSQGTISFNNFGGVGTPFSAITTFKLAEQSLAGYTLEDYLPVLVGNEVLIGQLDNLNNFGIYKVVSIVRDLVETTFFNVILQYIEGHGSLELDKFYGLSLHASLDNADKNYVFVQSVPATVWTITHNLGKFPSVSVVNINNVTMYGNVTYLNENELQIEFSAGFSGKAYMN
jgi:hypothetical protein